MKKSTLIVIGILVLVLLYGWTTYNGLVGDNEKINGQWAQVETQYQRRYDLIPNLVNSVKGIMEQEQQVFKDIADARTRYAGATNPEDKVDAANQVETSLGRLLVIMENYPQLRSSEAVQTLMVQLEGTENRISVERQRYNDLVRGYMTKIQRFPTNLTAKIFGFEKRDYFQADTGANNAPEVNL
jgi:LemA protein